MVFAILPTISFILLVVFVYILFPFRAARGWNVWVEVFGLMMSAFMFASYPLAFILGMIGLRQISKSKGLPLWLFFFAVMAEGFMRPPLSTKAGNRKVFPGDRSQHRPP